MRWRWRTPRSTLGHGGHRRERQRGGSRRTIQIGMCSGNRDPFRSELQSGSCAKSTISTRSSSVSLDEHHRPEERIDIVYERTAGTRSNDRFSTSRNTNRAAASGPDTKSYSDGEPSAVLSSPNSSCACSSRHPPPTDASRPSEPGRGDLCRRLRRLCISSLTQSSEVCRRTLEQSDSTATTLSTAPLIPRRMGKSTSRSGRERSQSVGFGPPGAVCRGGPSHRTAMSEPISPPVDDRNRSPIVSP